MACLLCHVEEAPVEVVGCRVFKVTPTALLSVNLGAGETHRRVGMPLVSVLGIHGFIPWVSTSWAAQLHFSHMTEGVLDVVR